MTQENIDTPLVTKKKFLGIRWTKKKIIWTAIIVLAVAGISYKIFKGKNTTANILTDSVKKQDIKQTVLATGQVVSSTNLDLSFKVSGVVSRVDVKEGDKVKMGAELAVLDQRDQVAALTSARGTLASAEANYHKVLDGASSEDITVTQVALDNAKAALENTKQQQSTAVANAYSALLNSSIAAVAAPNNLGTATASVSGAYTGSNQGIYKIYISNLGSGQKFQVSGLEDGSGDVRSTPIAMGTKGLYLQFTGTPVNSDSWTIAIPNTQAATYVANYNSYQAALQTQTSSISAAQNAVSSAQATLDLKKAQARPADVEAAQAQILSAQGQVQSAVSSLDNTIIRAPADGTVTQVDVKPGELASALKEALILQDVGSLHVEADISEANIATLRAGQDVDVTLDALGPDRHFVGKVEAINPASTVISGVVNYKVTATLDNIPEIKPGFTANMTILVAQKSGVLSIPSRAVISQNGKKYVRIIDDPKKKTYHQVEVQTGLEADGGLVEITSGLKEGQEIVTFIKQ